MLSEGAGPEVVPDPVPAAVSDVSLPSDISSAYGIDIRQNM